MTTNRGEESHGGDRDGRTPNGSRRRRGQGGRRVTVADADPQRADGGEAAPDVGSNAGPPDTTDVVLTDRLPAQAAGDATPGHVLEVHPASTPAPEDSAPATASPPALEGELLDRTNTPPAPAKPESVIHLIYLMWMSLDWRRAGPAAFLILCAGAAVCLVLGGLAYLLIGISPMLAVGSGVVAGGGAAAGTYRYIQRRRGRRGGGGSEPGASS